MHDIRRKIVIKIKICDVAPKGACSFYRGIGPFQKLHKLNNNIQVEYIDQISWTALNDCDILFLMRPVENNYIETLNLAKNYGVKVWIDFDDLLPEIPEDNPGFSYFTQKHIVSNLEYAIKNADIVTVSTDYIKDYYKDINPDIIVIENAFNDYNYKLEKRNNTAQRIVWRGSNTHRKDLLSVKFVIQAVAYNNPEWEWVFIGCDPWYVTDEIKNCMTVSEFEIIKYNTFLSQITPSIQIIPLVDNPFNHSKSNIAFIEGTSAGACCIAPDLPEFQRDGILNYKDENGFKYVLEKVIKSKTFRQENYEKGFQFMHDNLRLSCINKKRIQIIEENI